MSSETKSRKIIVGDVHGCLDELKDLLEACHFDRANGDELICVGDLVGKGPDSLGVLRFVRDVAKGRCVLGNHDHFIIQCKNRIQNGETDVEIKDQTHADCVHNFEKSDWDWLESLPYYIDLPEYNTIVVHAGLVPHVPLDKQDPLAMMYMRNLVEEEKQPQPEQIATEEVKKTTTKQLKPINEATAGSAWASVWPGPIKVVFGHDAVRGLQQYEFAIGLDTGCCYGGALTAYVLPSGEIVSVRARKVYSVPQKKIHNSFAALKEEGNGNSNSNNEQQQYQETARSS